MSWIVDKLPKVQKGIPLPPVYGKWERWLTGLETGDSVFFGNNMAVQSMASAARRIGYKVAQRKEGAEKGGGWRVWLVSKNHDRAGWTSNKLRLKAEKKRAAPRRKI